MQIRGRSCIAAFTAFTISLLFAAESYPSYNTEAGRKYAVASQRLADLKKSPKQNKYRSYWIDCVRAFELIEKKYPKSPSAGDACMERAELYFDLYKFSKYSRDLNSSLQTFSSCQSSFPRHEKAAEALFRSMELSLDYKKDRSGALKVYERLAQAYADSPWTVKAKARIRPPAPARKAETEIKPIPVPRLASSPGAKRTASPGAKAAVSPGAKRTASIVKSIRHWSGGNYTRIVIDQTKYSKFQATELKQPDHRLVFDILNARVDDALNKDPMPVNDGILKQVRASQYTPDTVRIVLDLASLKTYAAFPLHEPERLVIDVTGEAGAEGEARPLVSHASATEQTASAQTASVQTVSARTVSAQTVSAQTTTQSIKLEPVAEAKPVRPGHSAAVTHMTATAQKPAANGNDGERLSLSRQLGLKVRTIAIDAGHGGHDPGAISKKGLQEKTITLDIAKRLAVLVKERLGCNVVMTRDKDVFIPLEERPFIAKSRRADLFVSIHVNANRKRKAKGIETYIQSLRASDREAMVTAARENAMSTKNMSELKSELDRIFADLAKDDKLEESLQLAHAVQTSLVDTMKPVQTHVVNLGVKRAFFYVLINTEMPSILAEVGFISNPDEEKLLRKESYRQSIAEALYLGVKNYVAERSPQMMGI